MPDVNSLSDEEKAIILAGVLMPAIDVAQADMQSSPSLRRIFAGVNDMVSFLDSYKRALADLPEKVLVEEWIHQLMELKGSGGIQSENFNRAEQEFGRRNLEARYSLVADVLERRCLEEEAVALKKLIIAVAEQSAGRSGKGFLGLQGEKSFAEDEVIRRITVALRY